MHAGDILTLLPFVVMTLAPVVVALVGTGTRSHGLLLGLTLFFLAVTAATLAVPATRSVRQVTPLLLVDGYTLFFIALLASGTAVVALLSYRYLKDRDDYPGDYYALLLMALLGGSTLVASTQFASLFLGLELLSVSLYVLIAYPRLRDQAVEAAVKYLILAAVTAAFLLFGMALVYAEIGTMSFAGLGTAHLAGAAAAVLAGGLALIFVGLGFKLALVPFHMWTPDVYQGAPAPVTALIATVSKAAVFALVLRIYRDSGLHATGSVYAILVAIAAASMIAGNLLALRQQNVKRLLAYSSIAQLGYVTVAFIATGETAATAVVFYLVAYTAITLAGFGVVTAMSTPERDADRLEDYRGLAVRKPWLAAVFAVVLFALAGLPLTAGFVAKFYVVDAGAGASLWGLLIVLVAMSAVSLYYYTRIVVAMYVPAAEAEAEAAGGVAAAAGGAAGAAPAPAGALPAAPPAAAFALCALTAVVIWLGVYPTPLLRVIEHVVRTLP